MGAGDDIGDLDATHIRPASDEHRDEERRQAQITVAEHAHGPGDLHLLLQALGLEEQP